MEDRYPAVNAKFVLEEGLYPEMEDRYPAVNAKFGLEEESEPVSDNSCVCQIGHADDVVLKFTEM